MRCHFYRPAAVSSITTAAMATAEAEQAGQHVAQPWRRLARQRGAEFGVECVADTGPQVALDAGHQQCQLGRAGSSQRVAQHGLQRYQRRQRRKDAAQSGQLDRIVARAARGLQLDQADLMRRQAAVGQRQAAGRLGHGIGPGTGRIAAVDDIGATAQAPARRLG